MSQTKKQRITTPAGIAKFPHLNTPDTKWKKEGQYKVTLVLEESAPGVEKFLKFLRDAEAEVKNDARKSPKTAKYQLASAIRPHVKKDDEGNEEEVEGFVEVSFKTTATGTRNDGSKWERKVRMFDAKGNPTNAKVGSGSKLKVSFTHEPYIAAASRSYGIALYLEAVQVLELVEFGGSAKAQDFGFGEEEGFETDGSEFSEESDEDTDETADEAADESDEDEAAEESDESDEDEPETDPEPAPKKASKPAKRGQF